MVGGGFSSSLLSLSLPEDSKLSSLSESPEENHRNILYSQTCLKGSSKGRTTRGPKGPEPLT